MNGDKDKGWMDDRRRGRQTEEKKHKGMEAWITVCMYGGMNGRREGGMEDECIYVQLGEWKGERMDGWMDK